MLIPKILSSMANLPLLISASTRMLSEDPVHFLIQIARRTPRPLREKLSQTTHAPTPDTLAHTLWALALDRTDTLTQEDEPKALRRNPLPRLLPHAFSPSLTHALTNRLRIQQGLPPHAPYSLNDMARYEWKKGNIRRALKLARGKLHARYHAHAHVLTPGFSPKIQPLPIKLQPIQPHRSSQHPHAKEHNPPHPLNVLHILTNSLPWTQSGYSLRTHHILTAQKRVGINVEALTRPAYPITIGCIHANTTDTIDTITYRRILPTHLPATEDKRLTQHATHILTHAQTHGAHILHTTTPFPNAIAVNAAAHALNIAWVYEMRGELEKTWLAAQRPETQKELKNSDYYRLMRARETHMARAANAVIALSQTQRESLIQRGIPAERIHVIPNAVDDELLHIPRDPHNARKILKLPEGFWVGCISALVDYEGIDTLLKALAQRIHDGSPIRCAIVGDGVSRPHLIALAHELHINDRVIFTGKVTPHDVTTWYQALDVFVIPRKDTDVTRAVTPIKGLQAMALGIPQVVSDLPALVEVGAANGQGLTVPAENPHALANALEKLENDPALCATLGARGREAARERTWTENARRYKQLYYDLVSAENSGSADMM